MIAKSHLEVQQAEENSAQDEASGNQGPSDRVIKDHYRCPEEFIQIRAEGNLSEQPGFFRFGPELICYGRTSAICPSQNPGQLLDDALEYAKVDETGVALPFKIAEVVAAMRCERYVQNGNGPSKGSAIKRLEQAGYYAIRPVLPVAVRKYMQRYSLRHWNKREFPHWPVDTSVETIFESVMALNLRVQKEVPFIWFWPDGAQACAVMTHDVETAVGRDFCGQLMDIDDSYGVKSSFQVVPERRYAVPDAYLRSISDRGFEIDVHDLNHDGHLFHDYEEFRRRSAAINSYGKGFGTGGFRSGVLYRNANWYHLLDFEYDMSIPSVAHLDPQHGGCCTTFPYFIGKILEIPVTMTQDYTLFNILRQYSLDLWEQQISLVLKKHGVMNFIVHPDYIINQREQSVYKRLLGRLAELRRDAGVWTPLPREVNSWWRQRSQMKLVKNGSGWKIVGDGNDRARIAHAVLEDDKLVYAL
jgi:hypothetical protein